MTLTLGGAEVVLGEVGVYGPDITDLIQNLDPLIQNGVGGLSSESLDAGRNRIFITTSREVFDDLTNLPDGQTSQVLDKNGEFIRDGITSKLVAGQYTIWYNGAKGTQSLIHELEHPFVNLPNEQPEPHDPEFYIGTEEIARELDIDLAPGWGVKPGKGGGSGISFETAIGEYFDQNEGKNKISQSEVDRLVDLLATDLAGKSISKG
jgi:hypothetical protein